MQEITRSRIHGALLGTAVGDALGDPTEFVRGRDELVARWGERGIRALEGAPPRFTDDTQMTLFAAEGLLVATEVDRAALTGRDDLDAIQRRALEAQLRWRATQKRVASRSYGPLPEAGSLRERDELHRIKAPGQTCLSALDWQHRRFEAREPIAFAENDSKGCGGVMRSAPFGLVLDDPWQAAADAARLTHAHPLGWITAGTYADFIRSLLRRGEDQSLESCIHGAVSPLLTRAVMVEPVAGPYVAKLHQLLEQTIDDAVAVRPAVETVDALPSYLGEGWVAEEALAIGIWCALAYDDPMDALAASATHSGDTDSTAAITGCILGLVHGPAVFDGLRPDRIEGIDIVRDMADRLADLHDPAAKGAPDHPFPRTWWIERGRVLGGPFPGAPGETEADAKLGALLDAGVRLFANLQEPNERGRDGASFPEYRTAIERLAAARGIADVGFVRVPIADMRVPLEIGELRAAMQVIDRVNERGGIAYVHCWGGHGRTGTFAGCWHRRAGHSTDAALERIAQSRSYDPYLARQVSPQTAEQRAFIDDWESPASHGDAARVDGSRPEQRLLKLPKAIALAVEAHGRQRRKGTEVPYVSHLMAVSALVLEMGGSDEEAVAGILHDAVEDGAIDEIETRIRRAVGQRVLELVLAVSEEGNVPDGSDLDELPWHDRKRAAVAKVATYQLAPFRIALADKLHNARATLRLEPEDRWSRFNQSATVEDQRRWYESLATAFAGSPHAAHPEVAPFVREFTRTVHNLFSDTAAEVPA